MPRQRGRRGAGSIVRRGSKYRATWSTTEGGKRVTMSTGLWLQRSRVRRARSRRASQSVGVRNAIGVLQSSSPIPTIPSVEPRAILDRAVGRPVTSGRRPLVDE
jgi:hypothetical protein